MECFTQGKFLQFFFFPELAGTFSATASRTNTECFQFRHQETLLNFMDGVSLHSGLLSSTEHVGRKHRAYCLEKFFQKSVAFAVEETSINYAMLS